ncbi:MAG: 16S rRNA (uracil(1498)-N(3))-methyltransferase [Pseudohongiellaceae bacterium]
MRIPRVYLPQPLRINESLELSGEVAHYIGTVLRLKAGATVALFNGDDGECLAELQDISKKQARLLPRETVENHADPVLPVHIGIGLSRGDRMDIVIQKCTELGVTSVTPLFTERCEVKLDERRAEKRQAHWQKVAVSATEQSGRCRVPTVHDPLSLADWLRQPRSGCSLVLDPRAETRLTLPPDRGPEPVTLLSGPEGGLTDEEVRLASDSGFTPATLGPRILRTETAPLAAVSILQYLAGDL